MSKKHNYIAIPANDVPANIRFDVPRRHQGQIVEIAYGDLRYYRSFADVGAPYKREHDRSLGPHAITYYRLAEVS